MNIFLTDKNQLFLRTVELLNTDSECSSMLFSTNVPILYFRYWDILREVKRSYFKSIL